MHRSSNYSAYPPSCRRGAFCRRSLDARGAVFVEALIVISFMVIALAGLMYFKMFYMKQLWAMRLARASAIAYSLGACQDKVNEPEPWLGKDVRALVAGAPKKKQQDANDPSGQAAYQQNDKNSGQFTQMVPGVAGEGTGIINEMAVTAFSGEARITESASGLTGTTSKDVFKGGVQSRSHVSCSDKVRKGGLEGMIETIIGMVKALAE